MDCVRWSFPVSAFAAAAASAAAARDGCVRTTTTATMPFDGGRASCAAATRQCGAASVSPGRSWNPFAESPISAVTENFFKHCQEDVCPGGSTFMRKITQILTETPDSSKPAVLSLLRHRSLKRFAATHTATLQSMPSPPLTTTPPPPSPLPTRCGLPAAQWCGGGGFGESRDCCNATAAMATPGSRRCVGGSGGREVSGFGHGSCQFCRRNGEQHAFYTSHRLRDPVTGKVTCPVLRAYSCPRCGATGDYSHTLSYCSLAPPEDVAASVARSIKIFRSQRNAAGKKKHQSLPQL